MGSATDKLLGSVEPQDRPGEVKLGNATSLLLRGIESKPDSGAAPVIQAQDVVQDPLAGPDPQGTVRRQFPTRPAAGQEDVLFGVQQTQPGADFSTLFKAGFADDPETQIRIFAAARFPDLPVEEAVKRFGIIDGEISFVDDQGNVNRETPDTFLAQAKRIAAQTGSTLPSLIFGAIGTPGGPLTVGLGAGGGEAIRKIIGNLVFDEPQTSLGVAADIGLEAGLGAAGEVAGGQVSKLIRRGQGALAPKGAVLERARTGLAGEFRGLNTAEASRVRDLARNQFGIDLPVAASTGSTELADLTTLFGKRAGTADIIEGGRVKLQRQIEVAAKDFLDSFAGPEVTAFGAGGRVAAASKASLEALEKARTERVKPLFTEAFLRAPSINTKPVLDSIDGLLADLPETSEPAKLLGKIKQLFFRTVDESDDEARARLIDQAARELAPIQEQAFQAAEEAAQFGVPGTQRATVADIRRTVKAGIDTDPLFIATEDAMKGDGIALKDLQVFFGVKPGQSNPEIRQLTQRWPGLFRKKGGGSLGKIAQEAGFSGDIDFVDMLLSTKTKRQTIEDTVDDFVALLDDAPSQSLEGADLIDLQIDELNSRLSTKKPRKAPPEDPRRLQVPETRLRVLDTVKKLIDPLLDGPAGTSIDKDTKRRIAIIKDQLVKTLDDASPQYQRARLAFAELSPEVDAAKASLVGTAGKLEGDRQVQAVKRIFSSLDSTPETVSKARKLIEGQDPEAWQQGLRTHFQGLLGNLKLPRGQRSKNVGAAFEQAVRGRPLQNEILKASMTPAQFKNMSEFLDILKRTGLVFEANSSTSTQLDTLTRVDNAALAGTIRGGVAALSEPRKALTRFLTESMVGRHHQQIAEALFSEEAGKQLLQMKRLSPKSDQFIRQLSIFLGIGAGGEAEREVGRARFEDRPIPALQALGIDQPSPLRRQQQGVVR